MADEHPVHSTGTTPKFQTVAVYPNGERVVMSRGLPYDEACAYWPEAWMEDITILVEPESVREERTLPVPRPHGSGFYRVVRLDSFGNPIILAGNLSEVHAETMRSSVSSSGDTTVYIEVESTPAS